MTIKENVTKIDNAIKYFEKRKNKVHPLDSEYYDLAIMCLEAVRVEFVAGKRVDFQLTDEIAELIGEK